MLTLVRTIDATTEPVSLTQAKAHCRVDGDQDDALFAVYITAARQYCEKRLNRALIQQTWRLSLPTFPWYGRYLRDHGPQEEHLRYGSLYLGQRPILLPRPPTIGIVSITYLDSTNTQQPLDDTLYTTDLDAEPAKILPVYGTTWPLSTIFAPNAVQVTYTAGYGPTAATVPQTIVLAMLMLIAHYYEHREDSTEGTIVTSIPKGVDSLLADEAFTVFTYDSI